MDPLSPAASVTDLANTTMLDLDGDESGSEHPVDSRLLLAIKTQHEPMVRDCLSKGAKANCYDHEGKPALLLAMELNLWQSTRDLVRYGANIHAAAPSGLTPLIWYLRCHPDGTTQMLGITHQHVRLSSSELDFVLKEADFDQFWLSKYKTLLNRSALKLGWDKMQPKVTRLASGLNGSQANSVAFALAHGVVAEDIKSRLVLEICKTAEEDCVYDPSSDDTGVPPRLKSPSSTLEALEGLLQHGADPNTQDEHMSSLSHALMDGLYHHVTCLLEHKANVNIGGPNSPYPVHVVAMRTLKPHFDMPMMKMLVEHGADLSVTNFEGNNALHFAAESHNLLMTQYLLPKTPNAPNLYGDYALHHACNEGFAAMVDLLLENPAAPEITNAIGALCDTPLYGAARNGHTAVAQKLLQAGADVNKTGNLDNRLGPPLFAACAQGECAVVLLLLSQGAASVVQGARFGSAIGTADAFGQESVLAILHAWKQCGGRPLKRKRADREDELCLVDPVSWESG